MQSTIWTIALISVGVITPGVQQIGSFLDEIDCSRALVELKSQDLGSKLKGICVQQIMQQVPPPLPPVRTPTPTESFGSSDAKSKNK